MGSLAPYLFDLSLKHLANIARYLVIQNLSVTIYGSILSLLALPYR